MNWQVQKWLTDLYRWCSFLYVYSSIFVCHVQTPWENVVETEIYFQWVVLKLIDWNVKVYRSYVWKDLFVPNRIFEGAVHCKLVLVLLKLSFNIEKRCGTVCYLWYLFIESLYCFKTESKGVMHMLVTNKTFRQYGVNAWEYWIETFRATTIATSVRSIELIQKGVCSSSFWN